MSATAAPEQPESIPAVVVPVALPELVPARGIFLAGVITGGALLVLDLGLLVFYAVAVAR